MPSVLPQAVLEGRQGNDPQAAVGMLDDDPKDRLAAALARPGRHGATPEFYRTACRETLPISN
jgi:hypothetical protein